MEKNRQHDMDTRVIVDETTIYEVDMHCYHSLTKEERERHFGENDRNEKPAIKKYK